jgi:hypothetical protein
MKPTERDLRSIDQAYGFLAGLAAMGAVTVILLLLSARPTC